MVLSSPIRSDCRMCEVAMVNEIQQANNLKVFRVGSRWVGIQKIGNNRFRVAVAERTSTGKLQAVAAEETKPVAARFLQHAINQKSLDY